MPKHSTFYVFRISDKIRDQKWISEGLNEKEGRRNLKNDHSYHKFECPKIELLSVHETYWNALRWRANDNEKNR